MGCRRARFVTHGPSAQRLDCGRGVDGPYRARAARVQARRARRAPPVRGGVASLWRLHGMIDAGRTESRPLTEERERFAEVARRLRAVAELPSRGSGAATEPRRTCGSTTATDPRRTQRRRLDVDESAVSASRDPLLVEERERLKTLAERVWWEELDEVVLGLAAGWRAERDRLTPRLVYATLAQLAASRRPAQPRQRRRPAPLQGDRAAARARGPAHLALRRRQPGRARARADRPVMSVGQGRGVLANLDVPRRARSRTCDKR
jgi:hypothetical protein